MQIVILCGGKGTRLREETEVRPKPMVEIGGRPILWHIMKIYGHYGLERFALCLGYKGWVIKQYFLRYHEMMRDFTDPRMRFFIGGVHDDIDPPDRALESRQGLHVAAARGGHLTLQDLGCV